MKKRVTLIVLVALASIAADQVTKLLARDRLRGRPAMTVIPRYLDLEYHENPGMAFGLGRKLPGGRYILIGVGLAVLVLVWRIVRQAQRRQRLADIAFGLVAGGAIGNIIDRIYLGRVVDFVLMHWQRKHVWPAYNVADALLVVGVGLLIIAISSEPKQAEAESTSDKRANKRRKGQKRRG